MLTGNFPRAAYRVQLQPDFGFDSAAALAPYLSALGVSHFFASPYLQAMPGSTHGYDIVDPTSVNIELGGEAAHARFCAALASRGLAQILDVVPNHMAVPGRSNPWWWNVLEHGQSSRYAMFFDVDWEPPERRLQNKVLLPVLSDHYGRVLESHAIRLVHREGEFVIAYQTLTFPVDPGSLEPLLAAAAGHCGSHLLSFLADACERLPQATATSRSAVVRRQLNAAAIHDLLVRLCAEEPQVAAALDAEVDRTNDAVDALDALLERQNYRLAFWRAAGHDFGYRRFFDINDLVGLRVEEDEVFQMTHGRIIDWVARGKVQGLRVDHPDGLYDPARYFGRLRAACPNIWMIAEKILSPHEQPPSEWRIAGVTGYDFLNTVMGLFVDSAGEAPLTDLYTELSGQDVSFDVLATNCKRQVLSELLASELNRLAALFLAICERHRRQRDYTRHELHQVLREVAACFPVYRTYVRCMGDDESVTAVTDFDRVQVTTAIERAVIERPDLDPQLLEFLEDLLLLRVSGKLESEFAMRFQQLTAPVMAKGVEDTALYRYSRLICLNEVGGDPARFGVTPAMFHAFCGEIRGWRPQTLLTTSNHDTKRSEDVRARIALLSEIPARWGQTVRRWFAHNRRHRTGDGPGGELEYLLYQTLVGAWPIAGDRLTLYMEKAARESKQATSWLQPNPEYEESLRAFIANVMADTEFRIDLEQFVATLIAPGRINSLTQTLLKLTAPGVPHIYQGTELWDLSLVDPDNRRAVDFALRAQLLEELLRLTPEQILARVDSGLPKLWLIRQALHLRRARPQPFGPDGAYTPLGANGARAKHVVAYLRGDEVAVIVPRLVLGLGGDWGDTTLHLPEGEWRNQLTGEEIGGGVGALADLLARFPVALLTREARP